MLDEHNTSVARIPVVKLVGGSPRWPQSKRYEVVAHATVDEGDVEFLSRFVWTLAKDLKTDYAVRNVWTGEKTIKVQMHREVWERHNGPIPDRMTIDHEDRDGLNNRTGNLRLASRRQQQANQGLYKNSKTGFKGVVWKPGNAAFESGTRRGPKYFFFGLYSTAEEAAFAYNYAVRHLHGEFAWTNPIPDGALTDERKAEIIAGIEATYLPRCEPWIA